MKLPRQLPPTRIEQDYAAALIRMIDRARVAWAPVITALPSILDEAETERAGVRQDAVRVERVQRVDAASSRLRALIKQARAKPIVDTSALEAVATKFAGATAAHQKEQLARQAKAALKIDVAFKDATLRPLTRQFVHENVALVQRIPRRLHDDLEVMVTHAVASGRRHKALTRQIEDRFGVAERHARLIARDQIGKFHAKVNHARQKEMGVEKFVWRSVGDERVRDSHREFDGQEYSYAKPPMDPEMEERLAPGLAIQCFPGSTQVLSQAPVTKLYRRWYRGESTVLHTEDGGVVESTPNHPLLTHRGWVAAQEIQIGDHVVQALPESLSILVQDRERDYPVLAQYLDALAPLGLVQQRRTLDRGFHGDAPFDQQVDVVELNWRLPLELDAQLRQPFCQNLLVLADQTTARQGDFPFSLGGFGYASRGVVRSAGKLGTLLGAGLPHSLEHRRAAVAWLDAVSNQLRAHGRACDLEVLREALHRPAGEIQGLDLITRVVACVGRRAMESCMHTSYRDTPSAKSLAQIVRMNPQPLGGGLQGHGFYQFRRIVQKRIGELVCHVYNLETASGWYVANGIVAHNCRCSAEPVFE